MLLSCVKVVLVLYYATATKLFFLFIIDKSTEQSNCTDGELRLIGSATTNQGRLEVCMNGAWGSVCDSRGVFTEDEAKVACRQLGKLQVEGRVFKNCTWNFLHALLSTDEVAVLSNVTAFGIPSGPMLLDGVMCDGEEYTLMDCEYDQVHMCTHDLDVAIICHRKCFPLTNVFVK